MPTLIRAAGADERCPSEHGRMLFRALRDHAKVPAELVVYEGEPHSLAPNENLKGKMLWDEAWFDKSLKGGK